MENNFNKRGCLLVIVVFSAIFGLTYILMSGGSDCIRFTAINGSVKCECDFKSSAEWKKFKEDTRGGWEAVVVDGEPCGK